MQTRPVKPTTLALALTLPLLAACATRSPAPAEPPLIPGDPSAPSQTTPATSLAIAHNLSTHPWRPFAHNILHGKDPKGVIVHTPDASHEPSQPRKGWWIPGEINEGIPYKWGGFDSPASFDDAITRGLAAGDVSSPAKRQADNAAVSSYAAGLDCSGFVSRCLQLPTVHDTTQLPSVCAPLNDPSELQPGDILNIPRRHVLLTAGWAKPDQSWIYYYETGGSPDYWKPGLKQAPLDALLALGYQPLRYHGMARQSLPPRAGAKDALTRAAKATATTITHPTIGEP